MKKRGIVLLVIVFIISCNESKSEGVWDWQGAPCDPGFGIPRGSLQECYDDQSYPLDYLLVCRDTSWTVEVVKCRDYCLLFGGYDGHCNPYVGGHHCSCDCNPSYFNDYCLDEETQVYCNDLGYIRFQVCDELWCGERAFCGLGEDGEDCYCP